MPITGPISEITRGVDAEDLGAAVGQPLRLVGRLDVLDHPARRRRVRRRLRSRSTIRSNARREVRTRSIGVISDSTVRIGLIFSADPSHAWAPAIRPPRRRYSSVSIANHIFSADARLARMLDHLGAAGADARGRGGRQDHQPLAAAGGRRVQHVDAAGRARPSCSRACSAAPTVPDIPPARWIETISLPASSSGS